MFVQMVLVAKEVFSVTVFADVETFLRVIQIGEFLKLHRGFISWFSLQYINANLTFFSPQKPIKHHRWR